MESYRSSRGEETVVSERASVRVLMWAGFPLLGAGVGWLVKAVTGWVVSLPWAPLRGPFLLVDRLVASFGEPQATVGALAVGAIAGLALAFAAEQESLAVVFSGDRIAVKRDEFSREFDRASVGAAPESTDPTEARPRRSRPAPDSQETRRGIVFPLRVQAKKDAKPPKGRCDEERKLVTESSGAPFWNSLELLLADNYAEIMR